MSEEQPRVTIRFRPAWRYQWRPILLATGFGAIAVALASGALPGFSGMPAHIAVIASTALVLYLAGLIVYCRYRWLYRVDGERLESRLGWVARRVQSVRVQDLRNINVRQTVAQRLLGVGDVEFSSAAGGEVEVIFFGVPDPMGFKLYVERAQCGVETTGE